ncbi:hypothetical protein E4P41_01945 [Geodermatophilus sp. DF01-2]|uniref:hypothetical protein n=1 Tax=Geodermatophilus sp. DF01-2 TaxID=2559610 RepID=UPI0010745345|nr:hypothetical protein [Geodermatophilus sp. DF01_2]TFV64331.1 hypothetical protein E4P41_01945 [Geodermatophilus sp. DF01_2]
MLELGRAGSAGTGKGVRPVLRDGSVVATVRASNWKEAATAVVGDREWVFAKARRELTGRWAADPEGTARLRARQTSWWRGTWFLDLEGAPVRAVRASFWRGGLRHATGGEQVAMGGTTGGWSPRPTLQAHAALPLHQQVFLLWLELIVRRRDAAVVGAGGGGDGGGGGE